MLFTRAWLSPQAVIYRKQQTMTTDIAERLSALSPTAQRLLASRLRQKRSSSPQLVAYVVADTDPDELREYCRTSLPDYTVPSRIVTLGSLPRTNAGKVDRNALDQIAITAPK